MHQSQPGNGCSSQTLTWDPENRLASVSGSGVNESYLYDDGGQRIRKANGGDRVFYPFAHYEEETGSNPHVVKYYFFNGQRVMMHDGTSTYLHESRLRYIRPNKSNDCEVRHECTYRRVCGTSYIAQSDHGSQIQ